MITVVGHVQVVGQPSHSNLRPCARTHNSLKMPKVKATNGALDNLHLGSHCAVAIWWVNYLHVSLRAAALPCAEDARAARGADAKPVKAKEVTSEQWSQMIAFVDAGQPMRGVARLFPVPFATLQRRYSARDPPPPSTARPRCLETSLSSVSAHG
jgi:hypothetical protein